MKLAVVAASLLTMSLFAVPAFAQEENLDTPAAGEVAPPADEVTDDAKPKAEGDAKPAAEGEAKPAAEGEAKPKADEEAKPKTDDEEEGEAKPAPKRVPKKVEPKTNPFTEAAASKFLESEFPRKVIEPAVQRTVERLFLTREAGAEQASEAVSAAMASIAKQGRALLAEIFEAIVAKDRAAYETATASLAKAVDSKSAYWEGAVAKFFPDLFDRGHPLVRVGVARAYQCTNSFIGRMLGLGGKAATPAAEARRLMKKEWRRAACVFVRRWAETRAIAEINKVIDSILKYVKGEPVDLSKEQTQFADRIKRMLERELIVIVGEFRESMARIRAAAERLAEDLPAAKQEEPAPATRDSAAPAPAPAPAP